jgi:Tfp pilus assembly protein PilO
MKGSDKAIVLGVIMAVVLAVFYFKVLSPKREKASALSKDITTLQTQVDQQKQAAAFGEDARRHFPTYYGRLVVMGKAVPAEADSSSLVVQLNTIGNRTGVKFDEVQLSAGAGTTGAGSEAATAASAAASTAASASSSSSGTTSTGTTSTTSTTPSATPAAATTAPTAATEATAANLPLGATVGPGGLSTMPYNLKFAGSYFDIASYLKDVDDLVLPHGTQVVAANGRLLTINGFSISLPDTPTGPPTNPNLQVDLAVTSYVTPSDEGLTAGASPTGPAPSLSAPQTQPASATVSP